MLIIISQLTIVSFGVFLFGVGLLMLIAPSKARQILQKAGSTNFINYAEITIRMIPAAAMIIYSEFSKFPEILKIFGWFMLITSLVLYFVPRQIHHNFSLKCAEIIKPLYFRLISPFSFLFGAAVIYSVT